LVALGLWKSRACGALGHGRFGQRDPILAGKKVTQRGGPTTSEPATQGQRREHQTTRFLWPHGQASERNQEDGAEVVGDELAPTEPWWRRSIPPPHEQWMRDDGPRRLRPAIYGLGTIGARRMDFVNWRRLVELAARITENRGEEVADRRAPRFSATFERARARRPRLTRGNVG
jgi:hypothetical protein